MQPSLTPQPITCPHCAKEIHLDFSAHIPDSQRLTITLKSEGRYLAAELLAETIGATAKCLQAVAESIGGKVAVFICGAAVRDGEIEVEFLITDVKGDPQ